MVFCARVCPSYPEVVTGVFFILMTLLWFTREPGFVPGWTSLFEKWVPTMLAHTPPQQALVIRQVWLSGFRWPERFVRQKYTNTHCDTHGARRRCMHAEKISAVRKAYKLTVLYITCGCFPFQERLQDRCNSLSPSGLPALPHTCQATLLFLILLQL